MTTVWFQEQDNAGKIRDGAATGDGHLLPNLRVGFAPHFDRSSPAHAYLKAASTPAQGAFGPSLQPD